MNIYNSENFLFVLLLCFTLVKDAAKSSTTTKITDTNKQKGFISLVLKPFQVTPIKRVDMESIRKNTMEWVHNRLIQFIQNLDLKIFSSNKFSKSKILERVADKKTSISFQWQDMKSHFLLPISKTHIPVYTKETIKNLKNIKNAFFRVLDDYAIKLQDYYNSKTLKIEYKYEVRDNSAFDEEKDLRAQTNALHREMASLLVDLPQRLMYWTPIETLNLQAFALILGPLRETGGAQIQKDRNPESENDDDGWGEDYDDDNYGGTFGGEDFTWRGGEETSSTKKHESGSDKSSDSSSSGSGSEYDTEFFDHLPPEYFLDSDDETVPNMESSPNPPLVQYPPSSPGPLSFHGPPRFPSPVHSLPPDHFPASIPDGPPFHSPSHPPPSVHFPPHSPPSVHIPPSRIPGQSNDDTLHEELKAIQGGTNWEMERALAREGQITGREESDINPELINLRNKLLDSLLRLGGTKEFEEVFGEKYPELMADIGKMKELEAKKNQKHLKSQRSHSNGFLPHSHLGGNDNNRNFDSSIQESPSIPQEVARPSDPIPHSEDVSKSTLPPSKKLSKSSEDSDLSEDEGAGSSLIGRDMHLEIKGTMTVEQEKPAPDSQAPKTKKPWSVMGMPGRKIARQDPNE